MDYRARIVAGTALALIMAAPSLAASPLSRTQTAPSRDFTHIDAAPLILAQAEDEADEEEPRRERRERRQQEPTAAEPVPGQPEQPAAPAEPPANEAPPPQTEAPRPPAQGEQPPAQPPAGGGAEPIPGQPEQPPANQPPPQTEAPRPPAQGEKPRPPAQGEQPPAQPPAGGAEPIPGQPEQPPANQPPPQTEAPRPPAQGEKPRPPAQGEQPPAQPPAGGAEPIPGQPEQPPANQPPPPTEAPRPPAQGEKPRPPAQGEQPPAQPPAGGAEPIPGQPEQPPANQPPPPTEAPRPPAQGEKPRPPAQGEKPRPPAQGEQPPAQPPAGGAEPIPGQPEQPPANQPPPPTEAPRPPAQGERPRPPAQGEQPPAAPGGVEPVQDGGRTPILDSEKEVRERDGEGRRERQRPAPAENAGPPPASDREAQEAAQPTEVFSSREEQGRRIERRGEREERRGGSEVLREFGDRLVIQFNNQTIVESDDRERIGRDAEEVYYEELPRGRYRETVVRPSGVQVVTIRDRYGDVIQRSRIMPDGREYFLVYADERDGDRPREWRDPAEDLPPLVLTIPAEDYILDAGRVQDPDVYYRFLDQPPVERVQRLYTIDEVKYSARVRDSVRRIDLDTITFDFGSASIAESEIARLEGVAVAMERMLEENPAETFLIEGHTDAVGSNVANLALSDRRAESVAAALTNVFGIPPENLVTQGYGEEYLKVNTQEPERENRRVAMRRITPLVAPVASSQ